MSYGLHHPGVLPPRSRDGGFRSLRSPSTVTRWALAEIGSHIFSGLAAATSVLILAACLFGLFRALGWLDKGPWAIRLAGMIGFSSLVAFAGAYWSMRLMTRPLPLGPAVEFTSGRSSHPADRDRPEKTAPPPAVDFTSGQSSPLYDRELDG
jgi:hypothetical protein